MKRKQTIGEQPQTALLEQLQSLIAEAQGVINHHSGDSLCGVVKSWSDQLENSKEHLTGLYTKARTHVIDHCKDTDAAIRSRPYRTLAAAAGGALLLGYLLGRRPR